MRKIPLACLSIFTVISASAAEATTLSVLDLGQASATMASSSVLGTGVSGISNQIDAPIVVGSSIKSNDGGTGIGWNPYGNSNTTAYWLSIGGASSGSDSSATFTLTKPTHTLTFVWGSSSVSNKVTLFSENGTNLGFVSADGNGNLYINTTNYIPSNVALSNSNLANQQIAGAIIGISSSEPFKTAVFSTNANTGGFEIGQVSAVPLPGALPLFGSALFGLGALGLRQSKRSAST